jgi:hypothetical protein
VVLHFRTILTWALGDTLSGVVSEVKLLCFLNTEDLGYPQEINSTNGFSGIICDNICIT